LDAFCNAGDGLSRRGSGIRMARKGYAARVRNCANSAGGYMVLCGKVMAGLDLRLPFLIRERGRCRRNT
jgi:hypothetical protein